MDANTVVGDITVLATTTFPITNWTTYTKSSFYTSTSSDVGETVYLGITLENPTTPNVFPRIDVVRLEVNK